jgi:hypothetical protein
VEGGQAVRHHRKEGERHHGGGGGGGGERGGGERGEGGRGCAYENKKWRNYMDNNGGKLTGEDGVRRSREENHRLVAN